MTQEELLTKLLFDLTNLNLPIDEVEVSLRPFSKTYYGRYFPVHNEDTLKPRIFIYPYENKNEKFMDYYKVLQIAIHEFCHHIQYTNRSFIRTRGVMHDPNFWKLYNHYCSRAVSKQIIGGDILEECATI